MTPMQREELDKEIEWAEKDWRPYNRRVTDGNKWVAWLCAAIAVPIAIIIGAEILWHLIAFLKN